MICYQCGDPGHIAKNCTQAEYASELGDGKPPWCGQCDRESRLVFFMADGAEKARRCYACHPLSQTKPAQFGTCKTCKRTIYAWDLRSECGKHQEVGILR